MALKKLFLFVLLMISFTTVFALDSGKLYLKKTVSGSFEEVTQKVKSVMKEQGFGVITEIDMDVRIREKIKDADIKPYKILGVCNPNFAYEALQAEENIGVFLPCKVIVRELDATRTEVVALDPSVLMGMLNKAELVKIGDQVAVKFRAALEKL
jgi:uncharacterized protein (DUF302 family)